MKKFFKGVLFSIMIVATIFPAVSSAADEWGFGVSNSGVSGVYSGNSGSVGISIGSGGGVGGGWSLGRLQGFGLPQGSITGIIVNILNWLLMIFGILGVIGFIISGVMYILAAGNDDMMEQAKNAMKYSIIGVLIGLSGVVIIRALDAILSGGYTI